MFKRGTGIAPCDHSLIAEEYRHRISAAWVNAVVPGGLHIISVYLADTEGLSTYSMALLQEAAALARTLKGPWIMAGDWNMQPDTLRSAQWLQVVGGTIIATTLLTCHDAIYD